MSRARYLRKSATECERILWRRLRNRNFANYKFRRQHPVDRYILDFYCPQARLGIELDGGRDGYIRRRMHDRDGTEFLANRKIMVLRFWNLKCARNRQRLRRLVSIELRRARSTWDSALHRWNSTFRRVAKTRWNATSGRVAKTNAALPPTFQ
jgi:very-short-patch-repair endonuclease